MVIGWVAGKVVGWRVVGRMVLERLMTGRMMDGGFVVRRMAFSRVTIDCWRIGRYKGWWLMGRVTRRLEIRKIAIGRLMVERMFF